MRPGLRSTKPPDSSDSSQSNDSYHPPSDHQRGPKRQGRGGGKTGSSGGRQKRSRNDDQQQSESSSSDLEELRYLDSSVLPDLKNYHKLGIQWGPARAEEYLSSMNIPKNNRPSANGIFEAQGLQSAYDLDKTMLCIVLKCSRKVLDEALLEGPLAREPNMYTNYQTYSVVATTTPMPGKGVSEGFGNRNITVGTTWSNYNEDEKDVFSPRLFDRLCVATSEAYALTQKPLGITTSPSHGDTPMVAPLSQLEPLSISEHAHYVPIFQRLVNLQKVYRDLHQGRLCRHSGQSRNNSSEKVMKLEISKIARQLHALKSHFNLHFHLLLGHWNPASSTSRALFQDEHTSCERWARLQQKKHLLECFTFESTKAPDHLRPNRGDPKPLSEAGARQVKRRTELTLALNNLITPYLRGGFGGKGDAHPKAPNLKEAFDKKRFRGGVKLTFQCSPDSQVTDTMLAKGPGFLSNDEVIIWTEDIKMKRYIIVPQETNKADRNRSDRDLMADRPGDS